MGVSLYASDKARSRHIPVLAQKGIDKNRQKTQYSSFFIAGWRSKHLDTNRSKLNEAIEKDFKRKI